MMGLPRFTSLREGNKRASPHLYVANCGPAVGLSYDAIESEFGKFGEVQGVYAADDTGTRVIVSFKDSTSSQAAIEALNGNECPALGGRSLHIRYSMESLGKVKSTATFPVSTSSEELDIPGLVLLQDFISAGEEQELLAAVGVRPWQHLAKRRVQHFGYEFCYDIRNVDANQHLGKLPSFVSPILEKIMLLNNILDGVDLSLDQLTVNEYPPGVGLSPHIDTHSAFGDLIFSLSLAGPCIMEFRRYTSSTWQEQHTHISDAEEQLQELRSNYVRKAVYLPPRSMLLMSGEARYAWHHYIPHHKMDEVNGRWIRRSTRVSFTFRKVRKGPCKCDFPQYCDSQKPESSQQSTA